MASFDKNISIFLQKYVKEIKKQGFHEEEELVFETISRLSVHSLLYFIEILRNTKTEYSGIKPKNWYRSLKKIRYSQFKRVMIEITLEFLIEELEKEDSDNTEKILQWLQAFSVFEPNVPEAHIVDRIFPLIYLDEAKRNNQPFHLFCDIIISLFGRLRKVIPENIQQLYEP